MVEVTIKRSGFDTIVAEIEEGTRIETILNERNIPFATMDIRVNGVTKPATYVVNDDVEIRLIKQTSGN